MALTPKQRKKAIAKEKSSFARYKTAREEESELKRKRKPSTKKEK